MRHDRRPLGQWQNPIGGRFVDRAMGVSTATDRDLVLLRGMATPLHRYEKKRGSIPSQDSHPVSIGNVVPRPGRGLLVLDNLMEEGSNDKRVLDLFTKDSHHRNITVSYLTQDLFPLGKFAKTINRNLQCYVITFKNPPNRTGMRNLVMQAFLDKWQGLLDVFQLCTEQPFGYLMLDPHPASDDRFQLWTHLRRQEAPLVVFEDTR